nr:hypothetical protein [Lactococcus cremoris]
MKTIIIEQWENEHYPLGRIKSRSWQRNLSMRLFLFLIAWLRCLQLLDLEKRVKFEFELYRAISKSKDVPKSKKLILNSNDRMHFHQKAKIIQELKRITFNQVRNPLNSLKKLPLFDSTRTCSVTLTVFTPTKRRSDPDNLQPTLKAIMDGFTESGLWSDDNHEVVKFTKYQYGGLSGTKAYRLEVDIEEV